MSELLPCPFCGGEAEILTAESMRGGYLFGIMCNDCCSRGDVYETEAEAIEAWNTRAAYHGYEQAAIEAWKSIKTWNTRAERTCHLIEDSGLLHCSECGGVAEERLWAYWHYCPNCGARVTPKNSETTPKVVKP